MRGVLVRCMCSTPVGGLPVEARVRAFGRLRLVWSCCPVRVPSATFCNCLAAQLPCLFIPLAWYGIRHCGMCCALRHARQRAPFPMSVYAHSAVTYVMQTAVLDVLVCTCKSQKHVGNRRASKHTRSVLVETCFALHERCQQAHSHDVIVYRLQDYML